MKILAYVSILALFSACQQKKEAKQTDSLLTVASTTTTETDETITFGFSNQIGTQVLAFEENIDPKICTQIIDSKGEITPISFIKTQKGNEQGVNLVPQNIANCAGHLCEVKGGSKANAENTVVIFNYAFAKNHSPVLIKTLKVPQVIDENTKMAITKDRQRAVKNAWKIADLWPKQQAYIVIFEPKKDSVLASLVVGNTEFIYRDYPAKYDEGSTWRVDDGGEFPNDAITIIGAFMNNKNELEIIIDWAGAEGANIEYAKANKGRFETIKEASRYWGAL